MSKPILNVEGGSHWYSRDAQPKHDADLRVARKENLYSSCTTIDKGAFPNQFLERWKLEQLAAAAFDSPPQPHEVDKEAYMKRIWELAMLKSTNAIDFGHQLHDAIEHYPQMPLDTKIHPWLEKFSKWYEGIETIDSEHILLDHDIGVAGRCDRRAKCKGVRTIYDWKTQDVKKNPKGIKKPVFYDSWRRQLAFYSVADAKEIGMFPKLTKTVSVIMDSNEPDDPFVREWTDEEMLDAYDEFVAGAWLWFHERDYWPVGPWSLTPTIVMP